MAFCKDLDRENWYGTDDVLTFLVEAERVRDVRTICTFLKELSEAFKLRMQSE